MQNQNIERIEKQILVTGVHRSGTSLATHLLAHVAKDTVLDDPSWAVKDPLGASVFLRSKHIFHQVEESKILKCPRMIEVIDSFLENFRHQVIVVCRNPLDTYASVEKAVRFGSGDSKTMADYTRFGWRENLAIGFAKYYRFCADKTKLAQSRFPERVMIWDYSDLVEGVFPSAIESKLNTSKLQENLHSFDFQRDWGPSENQPPDYISNNRLKNTTYKIKNRLSDDLVDSLNEAYRTLRSLV